MKEPAIIKLLSQIPNQFNPSLEYYYRRGNRFFFRTVNKEEKISFLCSAKDAKDCTKVLIKGKLYSTMMIAEK